jgi:hypothetical protein
MAVLRLQHVGCAVVDHARAASELEAAGLPTRDFRNDQGKGFQHDSRALLGNECWLHVVQNWNPESRVSRFFREHGPGLEHVALETDDIEADVRKVREAGAPIFEDRTFDANDGFEAFVGPDDAIGFTVELIQPHARSWGYPGDARGAPASAKLGRIRLASVEATVEDVAAASHRFASLFGVPVIGEGALFLGNTSLVLVEGERATGLERLVLESEAGFEGEENPSGIALHFRPAGSVDRRRSRSSPSRRR